jgi:hypothetical protein
VQSIAVADNGALYDLESSGALFRHTVDGWTLLDTGVQQVLLRRGGALLDLESSGVLWQHSSAGWSLLDSKVSALSLAADGFTPQVSDGTDNGGVHSLSGTVSSQTNNTTVLDELFSDGSLWQYTSSSGWSELDGGVAAFVVASDGTLYDLEASGQLWRHANGVWTLLDSGVQQIGVTSDNALIDLESNGDLWIYSSMSWSLAPKPDGMPVDVTSFTITAGNTVTYTYKIGANTSTFSFTV